jgi:hypothetical protein
MILKTELLNTKIKVTGCSLFDNYGLYPLSYYLNSNTMKCNTDVKIDIIQSGIIIYDAEKNNSKFSKKKYMSVKC